MLTRSLGKGSVLFWGGRPEEAEPKREGRIAASCLARKVASPTRYSSSRLFPVSILLCLRYQPVDMFKVHLAPFLSPVSIVTRPPRHSPPWDC